jgi:hypothetical protein
MERRTVDLELEHLRSDRGARSEGELGETTWTLIRARQAQFASEQTATNRNLSRAMRRSAHGNAEEWSSAIERLETKVDRLYTAEERRLTVGVEKAGDNVTSVESQMTERERWFDEDPDVPRRLRPSPARSTASRPRPTVIGKTFWLQSIRIGTGAPPSTATIPILVMTNVIAVTAAGSGCNSRASTPPWGSWAMSPDRSKSLEHS